MGSGQQLLTIAAIVLLSVLIINVNQASNQRLTAMYSNEAVLTGTGIAESMIDEIESKAFDQNTVNKSVSDVSELTGVYNLGPELGETNSLNFNDVDDYNDYITTDSLERMGTFHIKVSVAYIKTMDPSIETNSRTFTKKISVFVTNKNLSDTLKLYDAVSY